MERLRALCLSLPESSEVVTWGHPTFRARGKVFATCGVDEDGQMSVTVKTDPMTQQALVRSGDRFRMADYVGRFGWVSMVIDDRADWAEVEVLVMASYRAVASKRMVAALYRMEG